MPLIMALGGSGRQISGNSEAILVYKGVLENPGLREWPHEWAWEPMWTTFVGSAVICNVGSGKGERTSFNMELLEYTVLQINKFNRSKMQT